MAVNIVGSIRALEVSSPVVSIGEVRSVDGLGTPEFEPTSLFKAEASSLIVRVLVVLLAVDFFVLGESKNSQG